MSPIRMLFVLFVVLACAGVHGQTVPPIFANLRVITNPSYSGDFLSARMQYFECLGPDTTRGAAQVVRAGNTVTLTINMVAVPGNLCGTPPPPYDVDYPLGSFAPGTYTLVENTISATAGVTYPPLTTTFVVGVAASPIPTLSPWMMATLALALLLSAWRTMGIRVRLKPL